MLVVARGKDGDNNYLQSSEILNLKTRKWSPGPDLPDPNAFGGSVQFKDTFLTIGGFDGFHLFDTIYQYKSSSNSWIRRREKLAKARASFAAFLVPDEVAACRN